MKDVPEFKIFRCYDPDLIAMLHKRIFPCDAPYDGRSLDWVIMNHRGKAVGFCQLGEPENGIAFMARAGVLPSYQGLGLHRRMIVVREKEARRRGYSMLMTYTKVHNIQSSVNLQKHGYRLYRPKDPGEEIDVLHWRKKL
jgi:GNAT superfamily N-acetyltransferase